MVVCYTVMENKYIFLGLVATFLVTVFINLYLCGILMCGILILILAFYAALLTTFYLVNYSLCEIFSSVTNVNSVS